MFSLLGAGTRAVRPSLSLLSSSASTSLRVTRWSANGLYYRMVSTSTASFCDQPAEQEEVREKTEEEIRQERKARKEAKKKKKKAKNASQNIEEDEVERKKRERREANAAVEYTGDGSEVDVDGDDLNDAVICERLDKMYERDNETSLLKMKHQYAAEKRAVDAMLPSQRYWTTFNVTPNPYNRIRFNQAFSKWAKRDLRNLSNEQYQNLKFNTFARMNATQKYHQIFPDIIGKFTPTINLQAVFDHPIARDVLVYYGNLIPAEMTVKAPEIRFRGAYKSLYTLMLVDAKNEDILEDYDTSIQWLITNIPGESGDISQGEELVEYLGPTPLKDFHPQRLVFLLFRQRDGELKLENFQRIKTDQFHEREPFDAKEFALQNELLPRGLSFFTCSHDHSVPKTLAKFGMGEPVFINEEHIRRKKERLLKKDLTREGTAKKFTWQIAEDSQVKE